MKPAKKQLTFFSKKITTAHGGSLRSTRRGRGARTLSIQHSMHLVLRSTKATKLWSFARPEHRQRIYKIIHHHGAKNFIKIVSYANAGNHIHLHIQLASRRGYFAFIRAITGAIALAVTKASKTSKLVKTHKDRFWDCRPYTIIVSSFKHFFNLKEYIAINGLEGQGHDRTNARLMYARSLDEETARRKLKRKSK